MTIYEKNDLEKIKDIYKKKLKNSLDVNCKDELNETRVKFFRNLLKKQEFSIDVDNLTDILLNED